MRPFGPMKSAPFHIERIERSWKWVLHALENEKSPWAVLDSVFIERQRIVLWVYPDTKNTIQRKGSSELIPASICARFSAQKPPTRGFIAIQSDPSGAIRPRFLSATELNDVLESLSISKDFVLSPYISTAKAFSLIEHQWLELSTRLLESTWLISQGERRRVNDFVLQNAIQSNVSWLVRLIEKKHNCCVEACTTLWIRTEEGNLLLWRTASLATYSSSKALALNVDTNPQTDCNDLTPSENLKLGAPHSLRDLKHRKSPLALCKLQGNGNSEALWRPLWEYSKDLAVDRITRSDAAEFHSFHSPYPAIEMVACAASSLLSNRRIQNWHTAKTHFSVEKIKTSLQQFQLEGVSFSVILYVTTYARNPRFRPKQVQVINVCASKFCDWILSVLQAFAWKNSNAFRNYSEVFMVLSTLKPEFNRVSVKPSLESIDSEDVLRKAAYRKTYTSSRSEVRLHSLVPRGIDRTHGMFACKDGVTTIPYAILGQKDGSCSRCFVVFQDFFDTLESLKTYFSPFLGAQDGVCMLLFNFPGQANSSFPSQSMLPSKSVMSNLWLASKVNELLESLSILTSTRPFHVIGFGNGGNIAVAWSALFGTRTKYREVFYSLVLCNAFAKIDDRLTNILHDCIKLFSCLPPSQPDLPSKTYLQKFLYSSPFLTRVESQIERWVDPETWNNITLDGRIQICQGALCHTDLTPHLQTLCDVPLILIQGNQDTLVSPENAETFLRFRQRVVHVRQTQFREDIASLRISEKINELWRDGGAGALVVWLEAGHEVRYEAKDELISVLASLVHFEGHRGRTEAGGIVKAQEREFLSNVKQSNDEFSIEAMESCLEKLRREQELRRVEWEQTFSSSSLTGSENVLLKDTGGFVTVRQNPSFPTFARLRKLPVTKSQKEPTEHDIFDLGQIYRNGILSLSDTEVKSQDEYALCIQKRAQGYLVRKRVIRKRASHRISRFVRRFLLVKRWKHTAICLLMEYKKRQIAVEKLQIFWRQAFRRLYQERQQRTNSVTIQRIFRGYCGRVKTAFKRKQRDLSRMKNVKAVKIQSVWRMFVIRNPYLQWRYTFLAARTIQKVYRGHLDRRQVAQKKRWNDASFGQERLELGLEMIERSKKAFDKQKSDLDEVHRAQRVAEGQVDAIQTELRASECDIASLKSELEALHNPKAFTPTGSHSETSIAWERKKRNLELELSSVWSQVEEKKATLIGMERSLAEMVALRQRKDREFTRLQRNLMELLSEQKVELENLREKGIELESATATSAAAAFLTASKAKENECRSREMFESTEELLKFQFMSMSLSYFSSINMLKNLREMNSDTTNAAISSTAETAAAASAAAMAANLKPFSHLSPGKAEPQKTLDALELKESKRVTLPTNVFDWTIQHVGVWLDALSLSQYKGAFLEAAVDGEFLLELRPEDLGENLGVCHKLHVQKILIARKKLLSKTPTTTSETDRIYIKDAHSDNTQASLENVFSQARNGRVQLVERCLKGGFPVNKRDDKGNTLLIVACQNANQLLVEFLLGQKADINLQNFQGNTALHYAFAYDTSGVLAEYMIGQGADDTIENVYGLSPYDGPSI
uniref:Uncharacterized protein AlNc14C2G226 n=1 Tax=Albugo laibachii Nc14 TaxID=890382 RepID=F0VZ85_9STRA|nr:conserved unknown protein putative [Albugo laibachii Nc14]|eukprot:CCA14115.1 conserved unknown protein putative [Albugo laibachii Nc14]